MKLAALVLSFVCSSTIAADSKAESLDGVWLPATAEIGGKAFPDEVRKSITLEIKGDEYNVTVGTQADRGVCKVDAKASPKTLDITGVEGPNKGRTILAIYERKGDTLRICYELGGKSRPTEFKSTPGSRLFLVEYKLKKS